ncbi:hypothetical protein ACIBF7_30435 [Nonomuraea sp. NPDC050478]|uniref:hypothetical protein n=1 Tax=Nonomuraea sp. NPDC050478 TaxID=3364365 RepID=UPI00378C9ABB
MDVVVPVHGVDPGQDGMPSGVASAAFWNLSYMSAQGAGALGDGADPPPDSTDPRR